MIHRQLFNKSTLNIFTDASVSSIMVDGKKVSLSCPGAIAVYEDEVIDTKITIEYDSTNNDGEAKAILYGILLALQHRNNYQFINLFSDSKITVFGLREWIFKWNIHEEILYNTSGPVKNQNVFSNIIRLITDNNLRINLYHQKGHCNYDMKGMTKAKSTFLESNGYELTEDITVETIIKYNNVIDKVTRNYLLALKDSIVPMKPVVPIYYVPESFNLNKYKQLLGGN